MAQNLYKSVAEIKALVGKELLEYYNAVAAALVVSSVRRFADNATGHKRTIALVEQYSKKFPMAEMKATPAPKAKAPKAEKTPGTRGRARGTNLQPLGHEPMPCREGSKQAIMVDLLRRKEGATMAELLEGLSGGNKPWTEVTVRSGFGWDLKNKGYGIQSSFDAEGLEHFHLTVPEKFPKIPAHTPLKTAVPKAHAGQKRLA